MMIRKTFGINDVGTETDKTLLEAFRLGDAAEGGDFAAFDGFEPVPFAGEDVLKVQGMMDALDDAGGGVILGDAEAELLDIVIAFGDEDGAGAGEMGRRFTERAARLKMFVAKRLLAVDQHDVLTTAA